MEKINLSNQTKSTVKVLQSKSKFFICIISNFTLGEYVHQLADKSVAQILSNHRPSPGNMYFSTSKSTAADLEEEFTNRMKETGSKVTSRTIKHASKTFDEIISQDVHFGTLLNKIKNAYDSYIRSKCGEIQSEDEFPTYDELDAKLKNSERIIQEKNQVINKLEKEFLTMRDDMEKAYIEERQTKDSIIHDLKSRIDTLDSQLTILKKDNDDLKFKLRTGGDSDKDKEIKNLIHDNTILNEE